MSDSFSSFDGEFDRFSVVPLEERLREIPQIATPLENRLSRYGLSADDVELEELVVEESLELTPENVSSMRELRPESAAELKRWIGVDNDSAPVPEREDLLEQIPSPEEVEQALDSNADELIDVRDRIEWLLETFVYRSFPDLDEPRQRSLDLWARTVRPWLVPFKVVEVKSGSVLDLSSNGNTVLAADIVRVHHGGTIAYNSATKIDTTLFETVP